MVSRMWRCASGRGLVGALDAVLDPCAFGVLDGCDADRACRCRAGAEDVAQQHLVGAAGLPVGKGGPGPTRSAVGRDVQVVKWYTR